VTVLHFKGLTSKNHCLTTRCINKSEIYKSRYCQAAVAVLAFALWDHLGDQSYRWVVGISLFVVDPRAEMLISKNKLFCSGNRLHY